MFSARNRRCSFNIWGFKSPPLMKHGQHHVYGCVFKDDYITMTIQFSIDINSVHDVCITVTFQHYQPSSLAALLLAMLAAVQKCSALQRSQLVIIISVEKPIRLTWSQVHGHSQKCKFCFFIQMVIRSPILVGQPLVDDVLIISKDFLCVRICKEYFLDSYFRFIRF